MSFIGITYYRSIYCFCSTWRYWFYLTYTRVLITEQAALVAWFVSCRIRHKSCTVLPVPFEGAEIKHFNILYIINGNGTVWYPNISNTQKMLGWFLVLQNSSHEWFTDESRKYELFWITCQGGGASIHKSNLVFLLYISQQYWSLGIL